MRGSGGDEEVGRGGGHLVLVAVQHHGGPDDGTAATAPVAAVPVAASPLAPGASLPTAEVGAEVGGPLTAEVGAARSTAEEAMAATQQGLKDAEVPLAFTPTPALTQTPALTLTPALT